MHLPAKWQKGNLVIPIIIGIVVIAIIFTFVLSKNIKKVLPQQATEAIDKISSTITGDGSTNRVLGKSNGKFPYAPIDEKNTVNRTITKYGGVVSTKLPKGGMAYLVFPQDSLISQADVTLSPYTQMPTSQKQGEVSNNLGYGVQVDIQSPQIRTDAYLVFDFRSEEQKQKAIKDYSLYCNPGLSIFNPIICANKNKSSTAVVNKNQTVITPIFKDKYDNLIFIQNTSPIGIDGLIVTPISKGDVFVPQKLDRGLATSYAQKTLGPYDNHGGKVEAAALANVWDVDLNNDQLEEVSEAAGFYGDSYQEAIKTIYVAKQYRQSTEKKLKALKAQKPQNENQADENESQIEDFEFLLKDFADGEKNSTEDLNKDILADTRSVERPTTQEAAAAASAGNKMGFNNARTIHRQAQDQLIANARDPKKDKQERGDAGESWYIGEKDSDLGGSGGGSSISGDSGGTTTGDDTSGTGPDSGSGASSDSTGSSGSSSGATGSEQAATDAVTDAVNDTLSNPDSSVGDLTNADAEAQGVGRDDLSDAAQDQIHDKLEDALDNPDITKEEAFGIAQTAQGYGFEATADRALQIAQDAPGGEAICKDLIKKNLKNFAQNQCAKQ